MKTPVSIFIGQETMLLRDFGKWVSTQQSVQKTGDEWMDTYLTFREEYNAGRSNREHLPRVAKVGADLPGGQGIYHEGDKHGDAGIAEGA